MKLIEFVAGVLVAALILGPLAAGAMHLGAQDRPSIASKQVP